MKISSCWVLAGLLLAAGCRSTECSHGGLCSESAGPAEDQGSIHTVDGRTLVRLGAPLAGAEAVSVEALIADPAKYRDKMVRVAGPVEDMCRHRRGWFAVTGTDGKTMVRIQVLPGFQVPENSMGMRAVAEGRVEVRTLSPEDVKHFSADHRFLGSVKDRKGPVAIPLIVATGAELQ